MEITLKQQYSTKYLAKVQEMTNKRIVQGISQGEMAKRLNVSRRSIINFENYKTESPYILWGYNQVT